MNLLNLYIDNHLVELTNNVGLLGGLIYNPMTWKKHINHISNKLGTVYIIIYEASSLKILYIIVLSKYGLLLWSMKKHIIKSGPYGIRSTNNFIELFVNHTKITLKISFWNYTIETSYVDVYVWILHIFCINTIKFH